MCIVADREVIVSGIKGIAAFLARILAVSGIPVIGGKEIVISGNDVFFFFAWIEFVRFGESNQFDCTLFSPARSIGKRSIKLDYILALILVAVVFDFDFCRDNMIVLIPDKRARNNLLCEGSIALSITESVLYFFVIVPARSGSEGTRSRDSIIDVQDLIMVTGLIVLVSDIDSFGIDEVFVMVPGVRKIGELEITKVLPGRGGKGVSCVGIDKTSGRRGKTS